MPIYCWCVSRWAGRQHSRASNNIYNGCLVSPRYHSYLQHISALLYPPTSHCKLELVDWLVTPSSGLALVISVVGRVESQLSCQSNSNYRCFCFYQPQSQPSHWQGGRGGWGSRLEIYLSVINHQTWAMNEKMSGVRDVRSHNQLAGRHASHLLTDWRFLSGLFCFSIRS